LAGRAPRRRFQPSQRYHRILRGVLILIVVLIIYGSLYPWHFAEVHLAANPLRILLHSWSPAPWRYFLRDTIVNIALYIPLGFAAHSVFRKSHLPGFSIYGPVLLGLLLSTVMELTQLLEPVRHTSIADVITNVIGSGFGVMTGLLFEAISSGNDSHSDARRTRLTLDRTVAGRGALMLVFCWVAWLFFPLFPVISRFELIRKLAVFEHSPLLDPLLLISTAACWYSAGLLLTAAGVRISRTWFALTLLAIPAQFLFVERQPLPSLLLGAVAGVVLFSVCHRTGIPTKTEAWVFRAVIVVRGLAPFHFVTESTVFDRVPFVASLRGEWQSAAGVLVEKVFYYGTAIWLLRAAGMKPMHPTIVVAAVLASIEIAQTHLPGRTPEITDPVLAILMGFVLAMLSRPWSPGAAPS
jgi:VanZ family protein